MLEKTEPERTPPLSFWTPQSVELIKWVIGTLGLGLIANIVTCNDNRAKMDLARLETDSKLISAVSTKFDTVPSTQLSFLKYIQPFITSDAIKKGMKESIDSLSTLVKANVAPQAMKDVDSAAQRIEDKISPMLKQRLEREADLGKNGQPVQANRPIKDAIKKEDSLIGNSLDLDNISAKAISNIESASKLLSPQKIENYVLQGNPQTLWCKKGYFVQFNGTLQVGVTDLDDAAQTVRLSLLNLETPEKRPITKGDVTLTVNNTYEAKPEKSDYKYQITLSYIGAGGKNPFTRAAYLTVAVYKKTAN